MRRSGGLPPSILEHEQRLTFAYGLVAEALSVAVGRMGLSPMALPPRQAKRALPWVAPHPAEQPEGDRSDRRLSA